VKILVHRIGSLGDQLVALPSLWALKENFPQALLFHLGNKAAGSSRAGGLDVFEGSGLFQGFFIYPTKPQGGWSLGLAELLWKLRKERFDSVLYLAPSLRTPSQVKRDKLFFRWAGIRKIWGEDGFPSFPPKQAGQPLPSVPREADLLLNRLAASGLRVPPAGRGRMELNLGPRDEEALNSLLARLPKDKGLPWIGIAPGSNMPAKVWPSARYARTVEKLMEKRPLWPVILGGSEDRALGATLIKEWGQGTNLAGVLPVRASAFALSRCALYLGNDTGVMHLAASVGTPCVAVFASIAHPGKWNPYGPGHRVFRTSLECEGCGLTVCAERNMECVLCIREEEVTQACLEILDGLASSRVLSPGLTLTRAEV
jgi:ADP-heptose:LPS heptosyltransferase